jgi:hypothetical protein
MERRTENKKEQFMKMSKVSTLVLSSTLLFSSAVLAGETNKGKLHLAHTIVVDGKPLEPGNYAVEWDGSGPGVQVKILQGKQTVATLSAHLTEQAIETLKTAIALPLIQLALRNSPQFTRVGSDSLWSSTTAQPARSPETNLQQEN